MKEYTDFLRGQAPYDSLSEDDLNCLVEELEIEYFAAGSEIVEAGTAPLDHVWVVRAGLVEVVDGENVIDHLTVGDTFGHVSMFTGLAPAVSVRALEDTLCLRLSDPRLTLHKPEALQLAKFNAMSVGAHRTGSDALDHRTGSVTTLMRPVVWAEGNESIAKVAKRISEEAHSCAVVRHQGQWGIATDNDFRRRVASGDLSVDRPIAQLATFPALSVSPRFSQAAAFSRMINLGVHHLIVTDERGVPQGIVRAIDFAPSRVRNPLSVRAQIEVAQSVSSLQDASGRIRAALVELDANEVPAIQIGNLHSSIVDAILRKLAHLHGLDKMAAPPSLIVLGSMARREPLPHSDVDTAMIWPDPESGDPGEDYLRKAEAILSDMESCGLARCANGANAVNPLFSRSTTEWSAATSYWLNHPDAPQALLLSSIVIDSRALTQVALANTVTKAMGEHRPTLEYLNALFKEATAIKPPTGFVREFVVDHRGEHRGELDLKQGGLLPIVAIGRWVAAVSGDTRGGTPERLRRAEASGLLTQDEADTLVASFEHLYALLLKRDLSAIAAEREPTTYIRPQDLDTFTRRHLRETFRAVGSIQESISNNWLRRLNA